MIETLVEHLRNRRIVTLAGAGVSTESGIPDYRGPGSVGRTRKPMTYQEFVGREAARVRYWARSAVGWPRMAAARPNPAHHALARLEEAGLARGIITQNVDGLHHAAGSRRVVELHGALARVICLDCGHASSREDVQRRILQENSEWAERLGLSETALATDLETAAETARATEGSRVASAGREHSEPAGPSPSRTSTKADAVESAPDGDAELPAEAIESFRVPVCEACGGVLKPDVVFFGENVPRERVDEAWRLYAEGDVLLVVGSSLTVYSGRRFIDRAQEDGVPITVVNLGPTRADKVAAVKVDGRLGEVLPGVVDALLGSFDGPARGPMGQP